MTFEGCMLWIDFITIAIVYVALRNQDPECVKANLFIGLQKPDYAPIVTLLEELQRLKSTTADEPCLHNLDMFMEIISKLS